MSEPKESEQELLARLNRETAKMPWSELQRFFAQGVVICVEPALDLLKVASEVIQDNKIQVEQWLAEGLVHQLSDEQALTWLEEEATLWAVVSSPWVFVQLPSE